jgi:predicted hydrolase (HD superfamily)
MKTVTVSATFDGQQIRLDEPYPLEPNARLLVTVLSGDLAREHQQWVHASMSSLARAYGEDEPEYPDSCITEHNPKYEGR